MAGLSSPKSNAPLQSFPRCLLPVDNDGLLGRSESPGPFVAAEGGASGTSDRVYRVSALIAWQAACLLCAWVGSSNNSRSRASLGRQFGRLAEIVRRSALSV